MATMTPPSPSPTSATPATPPIPLTDLPELAAWARSGDWRLTGAEAWSASVKLERHGWRAEAVPLAQGSALVEVRDLAIRGHPLVATLRTPGETDAFLATHGHGLRGRVPSPPQGVTTRG